MTYEIKKAKIVDDIFLEVTYEETKDEATNDVKKYCRNRVHADLLDAFQKLRIHLVLLCELKSISELSDPENDNDYKITARAVDGEEKDVTKFFKKGSMPYENPTLSQFKVTGITIGGEGESEGVTIIGRKTLKHNRCLNLVTPFTKWEDEHCGYDYEDDLYSDVSEVLSEVEEYLGGKYAPDPQLSLEFEEAAN